MYTKIKKK